MGYDITYHPIKLEQMDEWYFSRLDEMKQGDYSKTWEMAQKANMHEFYIDKYLDVMKEAVNIEPDLTFEITHGFNIAVVQGFFLPHYYVRGTAFSFLIEEHPQMAKYITSWQDIIPQWIKNPIAGGIVENYCGGVFISPEQVHKLLSDYEKDIQIKNLIDNFFGEYLPVFIKALNYSLENGLGLLEATDVVVPNVIDLNKTESYSNLFNCDPEGALIYREIAMEQIAQALKESGDNRDVNEALKDMAFMISERDEDGNVEDYRIYEHPEKDS